MPSPSDRRAQLLGFIAASRRLQLRLAVVLIVGAAACVACMVALPSVATVGKAGLALLAIVAVCAYWVTGSHILDWRGQLEVLAQSERRAR
jgi:hypothetical protein